MDVFALEFFKEFLGTCLLGFELLAKGFDTLKLVVEGGLLVQGLESGFGAKVLSRRYLCQRKKLGINMFNLTYARKFAAKDRRTWRLCPLLST